MHRETYDWFELRLVDHSAVIPICVLNNRALALITLDAHLFLNKLSESIVDLIGNSYLKPNSQDMSRGLHEFIQERDVADAN